MNFFTQFKCALCPRWSCPKRYQIGNRTYYSHLGFVRAECPKKRRNHSYLTAEEIKEKTLKKGLEREKGNDNKKK